MTYLILSVHFIHVLLLISGALIFGLWASFRLLQNRLNTSAFPVLGFSMYLAHLVIDHIRQPPAIKTDHLIADLFAIAALIMIFIPVILTFFSSVKKGL